MKVIITKLIAAAFTLLPFTTAFALPIPVVGTVQEIQSSINTTGAGKCMDVAGGYSLDGTPIVQYDCHNGNNQRFVVINVVGSNYMIQSNIDRTKCVGIQDNSHANVYELLRLEPCHDSSGLVPAGVRWKIDNMGGTNGLTRFRASLPASDGQATCIDIASGVPNNSLWLQLYYCHSGGNQWWNVF